MVVNPTTPPRYHHGDLPEALVRCAVEMLDADGAADLSLRAVARRLGVSTAAPYRHFPDRAALLSAVAAVGYADLTRDLAARHPEPASAHDLADLAVAYVDFALDRPGVFSTMFGPESDRESAASASAAAVIHVYLRAAAVRALRTEDADAVATGMWSLVHGLAFLYLNRKLVPATREQIRERVRGTVLATIAARPR